MSSISSFGTYKAPKSAPITADLEGWKPVEGSPTMKTWIENKTDDGKFLTGFWEATPGSYHVTYKADELIHLFEGKVTLTEDGSGEQKTFSAGDSLHIAAGFTGIWKTEERIRKIFAIRIK
ncbi:cupin domain-containing protein [Hyphomicrobium sp. DMF-1]|jgi:uncharacterized cupin superfamily protein|uniref:cupin domain-containing protein n=1 Tax=Hyphomicrobium sp. DMF-1 TaxID=3019544 RepID=UPI0022EBE5C3|nr:cupin domain-containing protein [Hyphomicrobium sp. DMF-1]WBT40096.1 cupin domain-containing protein [Hyphomicrobium sp. DMF-1]